MSKTLQPSLLLRTTSFPGSFISPTQPGNEEGISTKEKSGEAIPSAIIPQCGGGGKGERGGKGGRGEGGTGGEGGERDEKRS